MLTLFLPISLNIMCVVCAFVMVWAAMAYALATAMPDLRCQGKGGGYKIIISYALAALTDVKMHIHVGGGGGGI